MKSGDSKPTPRKPRTAPVPEIAAQEAPEPDAFLEEAKKEKKRKLLADHINTINVLRQEKRFTFREIADWLTSRGISTDHSGVYRAYLNAIPPQNRDPSEDWDDVVPE